MDERNCGFCTPCARGDYDECELLPIVTIPKGWKLVPIEPTYEMIGAAYDAQENYPTNSWGKVRNLPYDEVYKAMLEAAPKEQS